MGIPNLTVVQIRQEGIVHVEDLVDFNKDTIEQIAANLRRPAGRVPDPNPAAGANATIPTPPFVLGAKSQQVSRARRNLFATMTLLAETLLLGTFNGQRP